MVTKMSYERKQFSINIFNKKLEDPVKAMVEFDFSDPLQDPLLTNKAYKIMDLTMGASITNFTVITRERTDASITMDIGFLCTDVDTVASTGKKDYKISDRIASGFVIKEEAGGYSTLPVFAHPQSGEEYSEVYIVPKTDITKGVLLFVIEYLVITQSTTDPAMSVSPMRQPPVQ